MGLFGILKLAFVSLGRNKIRTFLTALGIIIAVASVITMVGLVGGADLAIKTEIAKLGPSIIFISPGSGTTDGQRMAMGSLTTLKPEDAEAIDRECPTILRVSPWVRTGAQVVFQDRNWFTVIVGVGVEFPTIRSWPVEFGEFFSVHHDRHAAKVCVLGKRVAEVLFGSVNPVGRRVRIRNIPFDVVGVMGEKGQVGMGEDMDDRVFAPFSTVQRRLLGTTHAQMIIVNAAGDDRIEEAKGEITDLLRRRHRLEEWDDDDFQLDTQADIAEMADSTLNIVALLLTFIASVSLMVGGIGIMNIMLVSVTERTREIGIRMAIGARRRDILAQFLAEAMSISILGGICGIASGILLTHALIRGFTDWEAAISPAAILISVFFSALVGVFFGFYPAWKASRLDPIESLRFE